MNPGTMPRPARAWKADEDNMAKDGNRDDLREIKAEHGRLSSQG